MTSPQRTPRATDESDLQGDLYRPFLFAEECGLALFMNQRTGKKFCMDKQSWDDLAHLLINGWRPGEPLPTKQD